MSKQQWVLPVTQVDITHYFHLRQANHKIFILVKHSTIGIRNDEEMRMKNQLKVVVLLLAEDELIHIQTYAYTKFFQKIVQFLHLVKMVKCVYYIFSVCIIYYS